MLMSQRRGVENCSKVLELRNHFAGLARSQSEVSKAPKRKVSLTNRLPKPPAPCTKIRTVRISDVEALMTSAIDFLISQGSTLGFYSPEDLNKYPDSGFKRKYFFVKLFGKEVGLNDWNPTELLAAQYDLRQLNFSQLLFLWRLAASSGRTAKASGEGCNKEHAAFRDSIQHIVFDKLLLELVSPKRHVAPMTSLVPLASPQKPSAACDDSWNTNPTDRRSLGREILIVLGLIRRVITSPTMCRAGSAPALSNGLWWRVFVHRPPPGHVLNLKQPVYNDPVAPSPSHTPTHSTQTSTHLTPASVHNVCAPPTPTHFNQARAAFLRQTSGENIPKNGDQSNTSPTTSTAENCPPKRTSPVWVFERRRKEGGVKDDLKGDSESGPVNYLQKARCALRPVHRPPAGPRPLSEVTSNPPRIEPTAPSPVHELKIRSALPAVSRTGNAWRRGISQFPTTTNETAPQGLELFLHFPSLRLSAHRPPGVSIYTYVQQAGMASLLTAATGGSLASTLTWDIIQFSPEAVSLSCVNLADNLSACMSELREVLRTWKRKSDTEPEMDGDETNDTTSLHEFQQMRCRLSRHHSNLENVAPQGARLVAPSTRRESFARRRDSIDITTRDRAKPISSPVQAKVGVNTWAKSSIDNTPRGSVGGGDTETDTAGNDETETETIAMEETPRGSTIHRMRRNALPCIPNLTASQHTLLDVASTAMRQRPIEDHADDSPREGSISFVPNPSLRDEKQSPPASSAPHDLKGIQTAQQECQPVSSTTPDLNSVESSTTACTTRDREAQGPGIQAAVGRKTHKEMATDEAFSEDTDKHSVSGRIGAKEQDQLLSPVETRRSRKRLAHPGDADTVPEKRLSLTKSIDSKSSSSPKPTSHLWQPARSAFQESTGRALKTSSLHCFPSTESEVIPQRPATQPPPSFSRTQTRQISSILPAESPTLSAVESVQKTESDNVRQPLSVHSSCKETPGSDAAFPVRLNSSVRGSSASHRSHSSERSNGSIVKLPFTLTPPSSEALHRAADSPPRPVAWSPQPPGSPDAVAFSPQKKADLSGSDQGVTMPIVAFLAPIPSPPVAETQVSLTSLPGGEERICSVKVPIDPHRLRGPSAAAWVAVRDAEDEEEEEGEPLLQSRNVESEVATETETPVMEVELMLPFPGKSSTVPLLASTSCIAGECRRPLTAGLLERGRSLHRPTRPVLGVSQESLGCNPRKERCKGVREPEMGPRIFPRKPSPPLSPIRRAREVELPNKTPRPRPQTSVTDATRFPYFTRKTASERGQSRSMSPKGSRGSQSPSPSRFVRPLALPSLPPPSPPIASLASRPACHERATHPQPQIRLASAAAGGLVSEATPRCGSNFQSSRREVMWARPPNICLPQPPPLCCAASGRQCRCLLCDCSNTPSSAVTSVVSMPLVDDTSPMAIACGEAEMSGFGGEPCGFEDRSSFPRPTASSELGQPPLIHELPRPPYVRQLEAQVASRFRELLEPRDWEYTRSNSDTLDLLRPIVGDMLRRPSGRRRHDEASTRPEPTPTSILRKSREHMLTPLVNRKM